VINHACEPQVLSLTNAFVESLAKQVALIGEMHIPVFSSTDDPDGTEYVKLIDGRSLSHLATKLHQLIISSKAATTSAGLDIAANISTAEVQLRSANVCLANCSLVAVLKSRSLNREATEPDADGRIARLLSNIRDVMATAEMHTLDISASLQAKATEVLNKFK